MQNEMSGENANIWWACKRDKQQFANVSRQNDNNNSSKTVKLPKEKEKENRTQTAKLSSHLKNESTNEQQHTEL